MSAQSKAAENLNKELIELCKKATTIPDVDAESYLHYLVDYFISYNIQIPGSVTSDVHNPELARRRQLCGAFVLAWDLILKPDETNRFHALTPYSLPHRFGYPIKEKDCNVKLLSRYRNHQTEFSFLITIRERFNEHEYGEKQKKVITVSGKFAIIDFAFDAALVKEKIERRNVLDWMEI